MNSVHIRTRIVNLLQKGDLNGVLQIAGRLNRIEQRWGIIATYTWCPQIPHFIDTARDPLLLDLLGTVKTRLDQLEEEEEDLDHEHVLSEESDDSEDMTDSSAEEEDVSQADDEDDSSQDIDDVSENDESFTETSDSGVCLSEYENR